MLATADLTDLILAAVISGSFVSAVLGVVLRIFFDRRLTQATEEVKAEVARRDYIYRADREWRERSLAEILGPVHMQLDRTSRAVHRWKPGNAFIEERVMKDGNSAVRDLLLTKAHLLPPSLLEPASQLIAHYDRWLEEFERLRGGDGPASSKPFVRVTEAGFVWPQTAADAFTEAFHRGWRELYEPQGLERGELEVNPQQAAETTFSITELPCPNCFASLPVSGAVRSIDPVSLTYETYDSTPSEEPTFDERTTCPGCGVRLKRSTLRGGPWEPDES
jgi:hypothetical protein